MFNKPRDKNGPGNFQKGQDEENLPTKYQYLRLKSMVLAQGQISKTVKQMRKPKYGNLNYDRGKISML